MCLRKFLFLEHDVSLFNKKAILLTEGVSTDRELARLLHEVHKLLLVVFEIKIKLLCEMLVIDQVFVELKDLVKELVQDPIIAVLDFMSHLIEVEWGRLGYL